VTADADEIVQETFARALDRPPPRSDQAWQPWLVRVATNLSLDLLRARKRHTDEGSWLPSPVETLDPDDTREVRGDDGPEARFELLEEVSFAYLLALEALTPRARAALLLSEFLDYTTEETAKVLNTSRENVRVLQHRARRALAVKRAPSLPPSRKDRLRTRDALARFMACLVRQDAAGLESLLSAAVRAIVDGGGEFNALRRPLVGRKAVATFHLRTARRRMPHSRFEIRCVNGMPAAVIETPNPARRQGPRIVLRCEIDRAGLIREIHSVLATRKLTAVRFELL
jgi:RNA polymerase sigma-70 factor (ECF subfamily)